MNDDDFSIILDSWIKLFDEKYTAERLDIPSRPYIATHDFFENAISGIQNSTKEDQLQPPFFSYWYDMVYEWFYKKYGAALNKKTESDFIKSFIIIYNMPYLINIPKKIIEKENDEKYWLIFPNNTHDNEDILKWIANPPNIQNHEKEKFKELIKKKTDILRNININLMSTHLENDECNNMLMTIFTQLESLVQDVLNSKKCEFSDSIWQISLAVEKILKVSTFSNRGSFRRIHNLQELLADFRSAFPNVHIGEILTLPHNNKSIDYRYGKKIINNIEDAEKIYCEAITIINTALSSIEKKIKMNNTKILIQNPYYKG